MRVLFADTFYYIALLNRMDNHHKQAVDILTTFTGRVVTTSWVLTELGDALAKVSRRNYFVSLVDDLQSENQTEIIPATQDLWLRGIELYRRRPDKEWSLTDCISFVTMAEHRIQEALTGDKHFTQAGYTALFSN